MKEILKKRVKRVKRVKNLMNTIKELTNLGYTITADGDRLHAEFAGGQKPPLAAVQPLIDELRRRKREALAYLNEQKRQLPVDITPVKGGFLLRFPYDQDFVHDLKILPRHARRWQPEQNACRIKDLYAVAIEDFILAHYGARVNLAPPVEPQPSGVVLVDFAEWNSSSTAHYVATTNKAKEAQKKRAGARQVDAAVDYVKRTGLCCVCHQQPADRMTCSRRCMAAYLRIDEIDSSESIQDETLEDPAE